MLVFGIDTCCMAATAALVDERVLVAETVVNHKKTHSQMMMPQIEEMFKRINDRLLNNQSKMQAVLCVYYEKWNWSKQLNCPKILLKRK